MLTNIFFLKWFVSEGGVIEKPQLSVTYPEDIAQLQNSRVMRQIILNHLNGSEAPVRYLALSIENFNIYSAIINNSFIIGLILDDDDNPYDYERALGEQLQEYILPQWEQLTESEDFAITNILLSLFIDIRRFADENLQPRLSDVQSKILKLFICGLDNAGKSTYVHYLKTGEFVPNLAPTRRFTIEHINITDQMELIAWDMPGQQVFRASWLKGVQDSNIFVFMVDLADPQRFDEAKLEFWKMLNRYELKGVPLLVLGNKLDLINGSINPQTIEDVFELDYVNNRPWKLIFTSVKSAQGIVESIDWIQEELTSENLSV
ncbi:MAG TPA: ADP-ribosylation factor-like protein [Candidatus Lokiarchaeia archaeon]|nr:ADP-ribosylation factor-like protein [Candidatus Lokiarchaeia archaeon]